MENKEFEALRKLVDVNVRLKNTTELLELLYNNGTIPDEISSLVETIIEKNNKCTSKLSPSKLLDKQMDKLKKSIS